MTESNNKRIAKNTVLLYGRMLIVMGIAFFISRELLSVLGEVDYGLANVVAGVVSMFSFLSGMMTTAVSRYFTFEIGRKNFIGLKHTFNLTQMIYIGLFLITLFLSETVGLWFFYNKIIIPEARLNAAFWFFQFSVVTFLIQIMIIPYHSLVISHENMKVFTFTSSFDAVAKLIIVYTMHINAFDSLIYYGAMLALVSIMNLFLYIAICYRLYPESHFQYFWDKALFKELVYFSGWNLFGAASGMFSIVFINILLNNYFGAAVNAARGIATQVSSAVSGFMQNFLTAARPQITKYWSADEKQAMYVLVYRSAKFGFFLMLFMSLPVLFETEYLLSIWLKKVPDYTAVFTQLVIIGVLIDTISYPLMAAAQATGKIAKYQAIVGTMLWMNLPISWFLLHKGYPPQSTGWTAIAIGLICLFLRLILVKRITGLPVKTFFRSVILPTLTVSGIAIILPVYIYYNSAIGLKRAIMQCFACLISVSVAIFTAGLNGVERKKIVSILSKLLMPIRRNNEFNS